MLIYKFDKDFYFAGSEEAIKYPLDTEFSIPRLATTVPALAPQDGYKIKFIPQLEEWAYVSQAVVETPDQTLERLTNAVLDHLNKIAQERNYDTIISACTYATSTNPKFQAEGQACVAWRDAVWTTCYQILADVQNGIRETPSEADLILELPTITWPI